MNKNLLLPAVLSIGILLASMPVSAQSPQPLHPVLHTQSATVVPPAPTLSSPIDMATGIPASGATLVWNSVPNCLLYECQYSTDSTFTTGVMGGSTGATLWFTSAFFPLTTYYWRVRASDGASFSGWSDVWQFNTDNVIGIAEQTQAGVQLFPMPCNQQLVVQSPAAMSWLTITDLSGRTVLSADLNNEMRVELSTAQLPAGIYILRTDAFVKRIEVVR